MAQHSSDIYDMIIVGGGPSGSSAAMYAARHGLKTLLLDKQSFPRDKVCGDALSGKSVTILRDLGLLDKVAQLDGATINRVVFGSPKHVEVDINLSATSLHDTMKGFVIRRKIFDNFMFNQAKEAATKTIENFTVKDLLWKDSQVCGIRGKSDGAAEEVEFRGKIVLGADGFNSLVARKGGLYNHDPEHWVVALRCYYKNVGGLTDQIELHYVDEVLPGYFWIFPLEEGYANVGIGMLHKYIKEQNVDLKVALQHAIDSPAFAERFVDAEPMEKPVGWNLPVGSLHRKSYGNGFLLLGDAAGLIDPFTGEGIGNAMYAGKYAAQTAKEALEANDFSEAFLKRYDENLWAEIGDELRVSTKLQKLGRVRLLLNFVINKAAGSKNVSDIIAGMMANEVPRQRLANPLFYLRLLFS